MPCDGCPEHAPPDDPKGTAYLVYTGGPPQAIFVMVGRALPQDDPAIVRKWSRPTVEEDGSIVYKQEESEPSEIEGYERDPSNPKRLRPIWPHCVWRALRVWRTDSGEARVIACCLTPASGLKAHEAVKLSQCKNCPHKITR